MNEIIDLKNLNNCFLIAMPHIDDPNFYHSVSLICEHNEKGALGFTINRPIGILIEDIFSQMSIEFSHNQAAEKPVLSGGPVQIEQGFVIHRNVGHWQSSLDLDENIIITTSRDILTAIAKDEGPEDNIVLLGYSGWGAGQLEKEIEKNMWLISPVDPQILFDLPYEKRWEAAAKLIGIDINNLTNKIGHA